jgi:hypothetical protein
VLDLHVGRSSTEAHQVLKSDFASWLQQGPADKSSNIVPFALLQSQDGTKLAITQQWLHHLQSPGSLSVSAAAESSDCIMRWIFDANPSPSVMPSLPGKAGAQGIHFCVYKIIEQISIYTNINELL